MTAATTTYTITAVTVVFIEEDVQLELTLQDPALNTVKIRVSPGLPITISGTTVVLPPAITELLKSVAAVMAGFQPQLSQAGALVAKMVTV